MKKPKLLYKLSNLKKLFLSKILGRRYIRHGKCNACGKCCKGIYIRHSKHIIKDEKEFFELKTKHFFYNWLEIVEKNEQGLVFECKKLSPETGKCTAYKRRARICRLYPQEELFMLGGYISAECGYSFKPIYSFEEVLTQKLGKKSKCF